MCVHLCKLSAPLVPRGLWRPDEDVKSPEIGVQAVVSHPVWKQNMDPQQEQEAFLIAELSSFQPQKLRVLE